MNQPLDSETQNSLAALLEDALPPVEQAALEARVRNEPEVCAAFAAMLRQDVLLGELISESRYGQAPAVRIQIRSEFSRRKFWVLAGAACLALSFVTWIVLSGTAKPIETAALSLLTGEAKVLRQSGELLATEGMLLHPGDRLEISGKDGRAEVRFADGSRISAEQGTRWQWTLPQSNHSGERVIALEYGALSALIEKQEVRSSYIFTTPEARVTVVGTRFRLMSAEATSTLELFEGAVRFQRRSDQKEILVAAGQRVFVNADASGALAATPLNPIPAAPLPQKINKALLVTAEPLPFYAHDVALQRVLQKLGFDVELITFDRVQASSAEGKDLVVVPSHKCSHNKVLRDISAPLIAWHNEWHRDLGLLSYDAPADHALKLRAVSWLADSLPEEFKALVNSTQPTFSLSLYSSLPDLRSGIAVLKLEESAGRSPLVLFIKSASTVPGPRVAFSIDVREGGGNGARVEIGEELFAATVRWCLSQKEAKKR